MGWVWATLGAIVLLVCVLAVYYAIRIRTIAHRIGSFECAFRQTNSDGWTAGIAAFRTDRLDWYRLVSLRWGPTYSWRRTEMEVKSTIPRGSDEAAQVYELECHYKKHHFILAMRAGDHSGFVSWIEGAPPHARSFY